MYPKLDKKKGAGPHKFVKTSSKGLKQTNKEGEEGNQCDLPTQ